LRQVLSYAESTECRRAIQLRYFDEVFQGNCGACDNCCEPRMQRDCTVESKQLLSCVARLAQRSERFGAAHIIDILRGSRSERILSRGHDTLSVYGIGSKWRVQEWRELIRTLLHQGLVAETQDGYPVLSLNAASWEVLRDQRRVQISQAPAKPPARDRAASPLSSPAASEEGRELFETLRALRKRLADAQGMPPYVIFHDSTLREIAERRPATLGEFAGIRGVGEAKLARYGEEFVAAVRGHAT
jgi:ATP-dependent DNA helicase RecQ